MTNTRKGFIFLEVQIIRTDNLSIFNLYKGKTKNKIVWKSTLQMVVNAPIKLLIEKLIKNGFAR